MISEGLELNFNFNLLCWANDVQMNSYEHEKETDEIYME